MKSDTREDKVYDTQLSYIIVKIDYDTKLILPMDKGLEFIKIWASGTQLKEPYNKPPEFSEVTTNFDLRFISLKTLKMMKMTAILEPNQGAT